MGVIVWESSNGGNYIGIILWGVIVWGSFYGGHCTGVIITKAVEV